MSSHEPSSGEDSPKASIKTGKLTKAGKPTKTGKPVGYTVVTPIVSRVASGLFHTPLKRLSLQNSQTTALHYTRQPIHRDNPDIIRWGPSNGKYFKNVSLDGVVYKVCTLST